MNFNQLFPVLLLSPVAQSFCCPTRACCTRLHHFANPLILPLLSYHATLIRRLMSLLCLSLGHHLPSLPPFLTAADTTCHCHLLPPAHYGLLLLFHSCLSDLLIATCYHVPLLPPTATAKLPLPYRAVTRNRIYGLYGTAYTVTGTVPYGRFRPEKYSRKIYGSADIDSFTVSHYPLHESSLNAHISPIICRLTLLQRSPGATLRLYGTVYGTTRNRTV